MHKESTYSISSKIVHPVMSSSTSLSTMVANGGPFLVSMEHENLCIISIPTESIPSFAWWLFREYSLDRRKKNSFHSVLMVCIIVYLKK